MLKNFTLFACLIISYTIVSAQDIKLQPNQYIINLPEGKTNFRVDEKQVLIHFAKKLSAQEMAVFFRQQQLFQTFNQSWVLSFPDAVVAKFDANKNNNTFIEKLKQLEQSEFVGYVAPVVVYNEKIQQAVYDLFSVKIKDKEQLLKLRELGIQLNFTVEKEYINDIWFCRTTKKSFGNAFEISRYLQSLNLFVFAEPDFVIWGETNTNDPLYNQQWFLKNTGTQFTGAVAGADLDIENAWTITTGIPQIKVAILDCFGSLAQFTHTDFVFEAAFDATGTGFVSTGFQGDAHGINCGGLIGATTNNSTGIAGIAYGAKVYAVKVGTISNAQGNWNATGNSISDGIIWAYENAHVVSNSNSLGSSNSLINTAILNSITIGRWGKGASFFTSSGNNSSSTISYPSSNTNTIAVGASSYTDLRASFSNYGTGLDIAAPGVSTYSTDIAGTSGYSTGDYFLFSGTSAACPVAAGIMALILSVDSNLTQTQARNIIESTCEKVGGYTYNANISGQPTGTWSTNLGYGRINAFEAVLLAANGPVNDSIENAVTLTVGANCSMIQGNLAGAKQTLPPATCSGSVSNSAKDVWYKFVAAAPNVTITCKAGANTDVVLGLYSGTAQFPVFEQCADIAGFDGSDIIHASNLINGNTYFIRVYDFNENIYSTDFSICIKTTPAISGNTLGANQLLCSSAIPALITGSKPSGGAGIELKGYKFYTDFTNLLMPAGWSVPLNQDTLLRGSATINSFGRSITGGAIFANNFTVTNGKRAQLQSNAFTPTLDTDTLRFDVGHAAYSSTTKDSLIIYAKVNGNYTKVASWASSSTVNTSGITSANAQQTTFVPSSSQWISKKIIVPQNSTQIMFEFYSGFGNRLYIDRAIMDSSVSSYSYQWLQSNTSAVAGFAPAQGINTTQNYQPASMTQTTWFKRVVFSSGFADTSLAMRIDVQPKPKVGYTINNPIQVHTGNSFMFTDTTLNAVARMWDFGNNTSSSSINPSKTYASVGYYQVKLKILTSLGCVDSVIKQVTVLQNAPTIAANNFVYQSVTTTGMQVSWTNGNGQNRMLIARESFPVNSTPSNGMSYLSNAQFGLGSETATGNFCVYKGNGNNVVLTNMKPNTTYYFALVEYFGDTTFSSYQQSGYLIGSNATLLPVNWLYFNANKLENNVELNWATASEKNNDYFEVQRSLNRIDWKKIGMVNGNGNTSKVSRYLFTDYTACNQSTKQPIATNLYYRLKQVDINGDFELSTIRSIDLPRNVSTNDVFEVYPNPSNGVFKIKATQTLSAIEVVNTFGQIVKRITLHEKSNEVNLSELPSGVYMLKTTIENRMLQVKVVIK